MIVESFYFTRGGENTPRTNWLAYQFNSGQVYEYVQHSTLLMYIHGTHYAPSIQLFLPFSSAICTHIKRMHDTNDG